MANLIRVCRIIGRLNIGGPAIHAVGLTKGLRARGYETVLVAGQEGVREGSMRDLAAEHGVEPWFVPELGREIRPARDLVALLKLLQLFRQQRPTIVHTHTAKAGTLGRLAAKLARVPITIHTFHGHTFHGYFSRGATRAFLAIERRLAMTTTGIVAVSEGQRHDLLRLKIGSPDKVVVIPLGLELDGLLRADLRRGDLRRRLGVSPGVPLIGIIARLVPIKDIATFLEAAADLHRSRPDVQFVIVGDGELWSPLTKQARTLGLDGCAHFLGWQRDLLPIYADLDLVALSSINEGTPVSLIEAMAAGLPVVATRVGGVPDLVEDGKMGLLVPPRDAKALSAAMATLMADADRRREMGQQGRGAVYPTYSDGALLDRMDRLYLSLLHARSLAGCSAHGRNYG